MGRYNLRRSMEQINGILQQVVIEILVEVQQEVQTDLLVVHDLVDHHRQLRTVPVAVLGLHHHVAVPGREEEVDTIATALPSLSPHDLLRSPEDW